MWRKKKKILKLHTSEWQVFSRQKNAVKWRQQKLKGGEGMAVLWEQNSAAYYSNKLQEQRLEKIPPK